MTKTIVGYIIFSVALLGAYVVLPEFRFSHVLAVGIALVCAMGFISSLSTTMLCIVVAVVTIVFPMIVLYLMGRDVAMSPFDVKYLKLENVVQWMAPTMAAVLIVPAMKRLLRAKRIVQ